MTDEEMTNKEAIALLDEVTVVAPFVAEAVAIAKSAIEYRIAKPVKKYTSHPEDIVMCPTCGSTFVRRNGVTMNFCNNCGQALCEEVKDEST